MKLPNGINQSMIDDAVESRDLMGEPFTPLALKRFINKCGRKYAEGYDVEDLIDKMVTGGEKGPWRFIFVNEKSAMRPKTPTRDTTTSLTIVDTSDQETAAKGLKQAKRAMK